MTNNIENDDSNINMIAVCNISKSGNILAKFKKNRKKTIKMLWKK